MRFSSAAGVLGCTSSGDPPTASTASSVATKSRSVADRHHGAFAGLEPQGLEPGLQLAAARVKRGRVNGAARVEIDELAPILRGGVQNRLRRKVHVSGQQDGPSTVLDPLQHNGNVFVRMGGREEQRLELVRVEVHARLLQLMLKRMNFSKSQFRRTSR